ncbi:MAG: hypothetical protein GC150_02020 [Rhizobiales bacterium]|nr:hypothetical protein [Hyphomicrobiales bacterium]
MAGTIELSIWIAVDAHGDYVVAENEHELRELMVDRSIDDIHRAVHHIILECPAVEIQPQRAQIGARILRLVRDE